MELHNYNFAQVKEKRDGVKSRNTDTRNNWLAKSMNNYRDHLRKTAESIEVKRRADMSRSQCHFESVRAASVQREQQKIEYKRSEEQRIRPAIAGHIKSVQDHTQRAQSARDVRVNKLHDKHSDWESQCEE